MVGLWMERLQIKGGSLSSYSGLKPHVTAWGEHTAHMQRNPDVTWTHHGRHTLVSRNIVPLPTFKLVCRKKKNLLGMSTLLRPSSIASRKRSKQIVFCCKVIFPLGLWTEQYFGKRCHDKKLPEETYAVREVMGRRQRGNRMPRMHWRAWYCMSWNTLKISCCGICWKAFHHVVFLHVFNQNNIRLMQKNKRRKKLFEELAGLIFAF